MKPSNSDQQERHPQEQEQPSTSGGRRPAGADPVKREQILEGAKRVFMRSNFDAASMNDITREAGVSKGTLYVYFENKEDLFEALIARERSRIVSSIKQLLNDHDSIEVALHDFGVALVTSITSDYTIRAMRTVLGVIDRMPRLAQRFFTATPENGYTVLKSYLDRQVAKGMLSIDDTELAAKQFIELSMAGLFKGRLFGMCDAVPAAQLEKNVSSAIRVFMAAYGQKSQTG
ncbi:TetR/AcrR family transcriptional regulator [Sinorhizobium alkalisoli]|uniref:TetR family transcriptional regulator n=1 Tax=Sinorhizobium alkalisoli TaxID=1752398 RepID=A0A1E3VAL2_9HYPH|nr:TetR/AcrR family transcriptional regulator [Sinorhizobium alkalisoli]MCA1491931.1 TetR/AcrR family transcriptional regulator [Ensifer sp. NBAIM29]MCG5478684.1 TetR/AcrR family transcriptional regulator [Sinorhizobium alkalisoli]ODR90477.1 TetR family transcriptional regulator [Sinorhizobium alkalisoli]QFI67724.1 Transcriptional regulator, TetR family [Sinorhizobium alkalisoli]